MYHSKLHVAVECKEQVLNTTRCCQSSLQKAMQQVLNSTMCCPATWSKKENGDRVLQALPYGAALALLAAADADAETWCCSFAYAARPANTLKKLPAIPRSLGLAASDLRRSPNILFLAVGSIGHDLLLEVEAGNTPNLAVLKARCRPIR